MTGSFESDSRNFGNLLGQYEKRPVIVPPFQRGYSWEKQHVAMFWSDLLEFRSRFRPLGPAEKYFLGPIVIQPKDDEIVLLDGQQRLATATIFFAALRDAASTVNTQEGFYLARDIHRDLIEKNPGQFALELNDTDASYFRATVQSDPPSSETPRLRSHLLIRSARDHLSSMIKKQIEGLSPDEAVTELTALKDTLAASVTMVTIGVQTEDDAFRIFETLNDRGLRLSTRDLLLNYLMRTAIEADRLRIRDAWDFMLEKMGQRDIDRFLRHMWLSKYGDVKARGLFTEIKEHLREHNTKSLQFAKSCKEECEDYVAIIDGDKTVLGSGYVDVNALVKYLDLSSSLPLLLAGLRCLSGSDFAKLSHFLLNLAVRYLVIGNLNPSDLENALYKAARTIRALKGTGHTSSKCLHDAKAILEVLNPDDRSLLPQIEDLYLTSGEAQYIMSTLANNMQSSTGELVISVENANLEHIFPQRADASWGNASELEPLVWHFGNLTVLSAKLNRKAANTDYAVKRMHYAQSEIKMTSDLAAHYTDWNAAQVRTRAKALASIMLVVWKI